MGDKYYLKAEIIEKDDDKVVAVASSAIEDRQGEIVSVEGWDFKNFKKAPRILWAHDHTIPAIGRATKIWVEGAGKRAKLMFEAVFQDITEFGRQAKELVKGGWIDTFSVGFMAGEMDGNTFTKQELLEISLVNVPANHQAQVVAFKSMTEAGITTEQMKRLGVDTHYLELKQQNEILRGKVDLLVKAVEAVNPKSGRCKDIIESKLALSKVIARATDRLLEKKQNISRTDAVNLAKIVKRANEKLTVSLKKEL